MYTPGGKSCPVRESMGKIDVPIFQSKKCEVPIAPRVPKPLEIGLIFNFEQLLLNKHSKIRSTSRDINCQR